VVCRVLISAFRSVPSLAPNIKFLTVLGGPSNPPVQLKVNGLQPNQIPESELSCALILKTLLFLLRTKEQNTTDQWSSFSLHSQGFEEALTEAIQPHSQCLYLVENGTPLEQISFNLDAPIVLVLGDDQGLPPEHEALVLQLPVRKVRIGTRSLLGSQVVSLFLLDLENRLKSKTSNS